MQDLLDKWIIEADFNSMQTAMESGNMTSENLVNVYLDRIQRYSGLNAIIEINPDAIDIARALDKERACTGSRGPLHGIPLLLKDNIDTHDNMHTSAGAVALADSYAVEDSWVAAQLRSAGAVLLGKANMTEWANFMSSTMWAGYSSRGGLTLNPYGPGEFFVGGSSSGSAAAIAANLAAAAIGTETTGSIICPASQNFIVGLKPTVGLISRAGVIPISNSQDTPGPMTRTVKDAAILLGVLAGVDERDSSTFESVNRSYKDYTQFLDNSFIKKARIGIPRFYYQNLDPERLAIMEAAIALLKKEGATVVDPVSLPCELVNWNFDVKRHEFKKYVNDYLARLPASIPVHSLSEVIAFNQNHTDVALKYGQSRLIWCDETSGSLEDTEYLESKRKNEEYSRAQGIDAVLKQHDLDALLLPGNYDGTDIAGRAGYPLITVPAGFASVGSTTSEGWITKGPFGVVFSGSAYSEPVLIKLAYAYEQATKYRFPPLVLSQ
ncbi:amidase family protein [Paenibacillus chondroitinus]|uniref:Amidase family protein n=1 Tax=Paenibacillus chondroitinus TaxID=59842 RepID=A0ABU6DCA0_9BACL|nr:MULTISPECIES: amidase family protein [Paenibacillus]MCY9659996.1 amidase family protein [Paenibacillus anseongense]MEB4795386.1 amidase family protein [Paenibacillus chondroitinus]